MIAGLLGRVNPYKYTWCNTDTLHDLNNISYITTELTNKTTFPISIGESNEIKNSSFKKLLANGQQYFIFEKIV